MKTKPGSAHRHKDSRGKWVTDELPHTHDVDLATLTPDDIAKLKAALVTPPPVVPPVDPPPVDPPPVDLPPATPPAAGLPVVQGYGAKWADGMGAAAPVTLVTDTGSFLSAWNALTTSPRILRFPTGLRVTIDLGARVRRIDGRANFLIDGRGADVTFTNGCLWMEGCHHYAFVNVKHRGGWAGGQDGDCFTNAAGHDFAYLNVSASGFSDEALSSTRGCANVTYQDCLFGPGLDTSHSYGSLNQVAGLSVVRTGFIGLEYRNPLIQVGTADVVNAVRVDCDYGISVHGTSHANETNPSNRNVGDPIDAASTAKVGGLVIADWATVPALTPTAAAAHVKANAGAFPRDAFDTALVARIVA